MLPRAPTSTSAPRSFRRIVRRRGQRAVCFHTHTLPRFHMKGETYLRHAPIFVRHLRQDRGTASFGNSAHACADRLCQALMGKKGSTGGEPIPVTVRIQ